MIKRGGHLLESIDELFDITIIGGGPAGLYASFYSGLREMKTKLIEFQPQLGGKIHVYPEKMIWDVGGHPPLTGARLIDQLAKQGVLFDPTVVLNEKIVSIHRDAQGIFNIIADSGHVHLSKTVLIATGSGILKPQKLTIDGSERFKVSNLHYTVKSLASFKDKIVMISGGGNSAIDWANALEPIAKKVYLTYRKEHCTGHESQVTELKNSSIECIPHSVITKLIACKHNACIKEVELTHHLTNITTHIAIDEVIINNGYEQDISLLQKSDLTIEKVDEYYISGNSSSESSVEGLYAAGDILTYDGKVNLITGAFQDAVNAVNKAKRFTQPNAPEMGMVSSHNQVFQQHNETLVGNRTTHHS